MAAHPKSPFAWIEALPAPFLSYLGGQRLDEVAAIIPDIAGMSRGKAMPAYKFQPDGTFFLPISLFYQTISGEYVDMEIENQWLEKDIVLVPDMATATAVPWRMIRRCRWSAIWKPATANPLALRRARC